ncbi:hypothetical protein ACG907_11660, partial [Acinetobacter bereziniae]
ALYRRSLEYGLGITAVSKVFYSVANFIYLAIGVSFDVQSIELEAILKKLDFNKPTMVSLNDFSVSSINKKNKINGANMMIKYISTFCLCLYSCASYASTSLNVKLENTSTLIVRKDKNIKK